jgi:hypothetical protein
MLAGKLRERSKVEIGLLFIERTLSTISLPSNDASSKYQLPALPITLELVVRYIKGYGPRNMLSFGRLAAKHLSFSARQYRPPRLTYSAVDRGRHISADI